MTPDTRRLQLCLLSSLLVNAGAWTGIAHFWKWTPPLLTAPLHARAVRMVRLPKPAPTPPPPPVAVATPSAVPGRAGGGISAAIEPPLPDRATLRYIVGTERLDVQMRLELARFSAP